MKLSVSWNFSVEVTSNSFKYVSNLVLVNPLMILQRSKLLQNDIFQNKTVDFIKFS